MASTTTIVVTGKPSSSPGTASKKVPRNTHAAATDMMIGGLDRKARPPMIGMLGAMLIRNKQAEYDHIHMQHDDRAGRQAFDMLCCPVAERDPDQCDDR